ncbi:MAG TPA: SGNH/GDSL hydrolase family protein [Sphingomonas sp.]|nr:SGNH/GDSL hydrolase family protein [Sphingomonas sp.]
MPRRYGLIGLAAGVLVASTAAGAQEASYQSSPPRHQVAERDWGPWLGPFRKTLVPSLMRDFGEHYLYADANRRLPPPAAGEKRVVFLGDSITDRWNLARSFPGRPYINRGIGSQVTPQMVLRFHQDVIALRPAVVVILAGVNDVQGFLQQETAEQIEANFEAMAEMARAHGIRVVIGSTLPVNNYTEAARNVVAERHPDELRAINRWLRGYCRRTGCTYADYYAAMVDDRGLMRKELTADGVHPNAEGYALMAPIARRAIGEALNGTGRAR